MLKRWLQSIVGSTIVAMIAVVAIGSFGEEDVSASRNSVSLLSAEGEVASRIAHPEAGIDNDHGADSFEMHFADSSTEWDEVEDTSCTRVCVKRRNLYAEVCDVAGNCTRKKIRTICVKWDLKWCYMG